MGITLSRNMMGQALGLYADEAYLLKRWLQNKKEQVFWDQA